LQRDSQTLKTLKIATVEASTDLRKIMQEAKQIQFEIENDVRSAARVTIQNIVDSNMVKVEKAIHQQLQKKGSKVLTAQSKLETTEHTEEQTQALKERLDSKIDDTFREASALHCLEDSRTSKGERTMKAKVAAC
jgi:hypothetical protein